MLIIDMNKNIKAAKCQEKSSKKSALTTTLNNLYSISFKASPMVSLLDTHMLVF